MPPEHADILGMLKRSHLFRGIDNTRLEAVVAALEPVELGTGALVYEQGDDPEYFYFVFSGRLKVSRYVPESHNSFQIGYLDEGDYFGQEVLADDWPRQETIETVTESVLLRLSVPNFKDLLDLIPSLAPRLQLILDSYRLLFKTSFVWLDPEETVYFIGRKHIIFLFSRLLPPLALGLITIPVFLFLAITSSMAVTNLALLITSIVVTLAWTIWGWVDWSNDFYIVTDRRVIFQERVILLYDSRQESPMEAVQSTFVKTSMLGRILGYGNVAIRTYIGTILFKGVSQPEQVMGIIQEHQARAQTSRRRAEVRQMEAMIQKRLGNLPVSSGGASVPPKPETKTAQPSQFQKFLSDLLHLRYESQGTILYRTHWFILLGKILFPTLGLIGIVFLIVSSLLNQFTLLSLGATLGISFVLIIIFGAWFAYQFMDWHNDVYLITPEQIVDVDKKPLGREERRAAPIKNILSIEYQRLGLIGLILNFGTVYIRVGDQELTFDNVFNPSEVQRELFNRLAAKTYQERQAAQEAERQRMTEWIAAYHRVIERNQPPRNPPARSGF